MNSEAMFECGDHQAGATMAECRVFLMGCGILKDEVRYLIDKNKWPVDTTFFDSALHCEFDKLSHCLTTGLSKHAERNVVVFYGACHPRMERILDEAHTFRTEGQNCVDMLLGNELFTRELLAGAFFLLEEWSHRWEYIVTKSFGTTNWEVIREMFGGDRKYLLCLRTPCSGDFSRDAEEAGRLVGLPLRWMDVSLDHLEAVLAEAITRKLKERAWRK
jgi:hypothetical protein